MAKDWNDLEYSSAEPKDNTLTVEATGATYDSSSQTIKWHSGDTFILKFKPEEALKETNKNTSIYDEPISDALDYFDGYKFLFAAYSLYGAKTEPVYEITEIGMTHDGMIPITIDTIVSAIFKPGIYSYQIIAYKDDGQGNLLDTQTVVGRKQGKIQVKA